MTLHHTETLAGTARCSVVGLLSKRRPRARQTASQTSGWIQKVDPPNTGLQYFYGVDCRTLRWIYFLDPPRGLGARQNQRRGSEVLHTLIEFCNVAAGLGCATPLPTWRLLCSSSLVMTCFLFRDYNTLSKKELHRSLQVITQNVLDRVKPP